MMQIGLVSLLAMVSLVSPAAADPLAAARWKSRILVVFSPNAADAKLAEQRGIFKRAHGGMIERHVVLLEAVGDDASSRMLRQRVGATSKDFRVLLIGKDGHTAMSSTEPLTSEELFRAIDAMPMRQDEMRRLSLSQIKSARIDGAVPRARVDLRCARRDE